METKDAWNESGEGKRVRHLGWKELYLKEDWWAIWLGLGMMIAAIVVFAGGGSGMLKSLAITPLGLKWTTLGPLAGHFAANASKYLTQFIFWLVVFGVSCRIMGIKFGEFLPSFIFLYILSLVTFSISAWSKAAYFNLEPPLVALILGLVLANVVRIPTVLDAGFRVEYYIKLGIILLGATFPVTLILTAGPVAIVQATVIALTTCLIIYFLATRVFGLDKRLSAVIGTGGSVCGISASMAAAAAVGAKKDDVYTSVTLVVGWALVMILVLPFISRALGLNPAVAGAWIGTSEFADAAGFAAASTYGKMAGNEDAAIKAFTLMKVIGRDVWIGIWSFAWALIATIVWEKKETGTKPNAGEIWWRFPKFVIGFLLASILMTFVTGHYAAAEFNKVVKPDLIMPLVGLRTWAFVFCFLSIGLTTRFRELKPVGWKTFWAFTLGVAANVVLGFIMSVYVFGGYWSLLK
ncbi:MAG: putative sulfate exporter family transporter [Gammaproteobacteria bacterium]|nr:putative sulfate exporter family transporter [Gammaproteobacteria bacterium]